MERIEAPIESNGSAADDAVGSTAAAPRIALVTGATQGLGYALAEGLAQRLSPQDFVYPTGRDRHRVEQATDAVSSCGAHVRGHVPDVGDHDAADRFADMIHDRHGGIDVVFNNAVMRVGPEDKPRDVVAAYVEVNNFGTTRIMNAFAPLLRDNGALIVVASSLGTLRFLAPVLHHRFDRLSSLDAVDTQIAYWRDSVLDGSALGGPWPGIINIPSKIGQVAAVRALAHQRRSADVARGILLASVCPGMMSTPTSAMWWDVSGSPSPATAATPLLDLVLGPLDPDNYGELLRDGSILPWK